MDIRADPLHSSKDRAGSDDGVGNAPWASWQEESWRGGQNIPMNLISNQRGSPSLPNNKQSNWITCITSKVPWRYTGERNTITVHQASFWLNCVAKWRMLMFFQVTPPLKSPLIFKVFDFLLPCQVRFIWLTAWCVVFVLDVLYCNHRKGRNINEVW